jgi:hypothetical protein
MRMAVTERMINIPHPSVAYSGARGVTRDMYGYCSTEPPTEPPNPLVRGLKRDTKKRFIYHRGILMNIGTPLCFFKEAFKPPDKGVWGFKKPLAVCRQEEFVRREWRKRKSKGARTRWRV